MLSKFFVTTDFTTKCDKKTSSIQWRLFHKFESNYYKVLQNVISKYDGYYKVRQNLLQSVTGITKCDKTLLQSDTVIKKWDTTLKIFNTYFKEN